jgi:hypothetical protein
MMPQELEQPGDDERRPLEEQLPPSVGASPCDLRVNPDERLAWWTPGWHDVAGHVGYRWIFLIPALGLLLLLVAGVFLPGLRLLVLVLEFKFFIVAAAIAISLAGYVVRQAVRARREPFCIHCGYNLSGLPDNYRCPECGRPYTWRLIAEYRRDPRWFIERYKAHQKLPPRQVGFSAGPSSPNTRRPSRDGT